MGIVFQHRIIFHAVFLMCSVLGPLLFTLHTPLLSYGIKGHHFSHHFLKMIYIYIYMYIYICVCVYFICDLYYILTYKMC